MFSIFKIIYHESLVVVVVVMGTNWTAHYTHFDEKY